MIVKEPCVIPLPAKTITFPPALPPPLALPPESIKFPPSLPGPNAFPASIVRGEPLIAPVILLGVLTRFVNTVPLALILPEAVMLPTNVCVSSEVSPNCVEPLENITEDETNSV